MPLELISKEKYLFRHGINRPVHPDKISAGKAFYVFLPEAQRAFIFLVCLSKKHPTSVMPVQNFFYRVGGDAPTAEGIQDKGFINAEIHILRHISSASDHAETGRKTVRHNNICKQLSWMLKLGLLDIILFLEGFYLSLLKDAVPIGQSAVDTRQIM